MSVIPHTSLSLSMVSSGPSKLQCSDSLLSSALYSDTVSPSFWIWVLIKVVSLHYLWWWRIEMIPHQLYQLEEWFFGRFIRVHLAADELVDRSTAYTQENCMLFLSSFNIICNEVLLQSFILGSPILLLWLKDSNGSVCGSSWFSVGYTLLLWDTIIFLPTTWTRSNLQNSYCTCIIFNLPNILHILFSLLVSMLLKKQLKCHQAFRKELWDEAPDMSHITFLPITLQSPELILYLHNLQRMEYTSYTFYPLSVHVSHKTKMSSDILDEKNMTISVNTSQHYTN